MADKFELKALIMGVDKLSPALTKVRKNVLGFRKTLMSSGLGKPISIKEIITGGALAAPFIAGAKAAIDFESSLADVRKVVDFDTPEQFKAMSDDILGMSKRLPMAAQDIAAIVASGGQAGLARSELGKFAEDAVKMGIAFDQTADESGTMMAKWRTSFRIGQEEVVALADKVNYLSDNSAATAQQIAGIVTRIGSLGEVAGLATGEIAAIGATLASMGVGEEQAATGMKNFMLAMTAGHAATNKQKGVFKALRLDAKQVAIDMQKDAKGTMMKVLTAISKVDKSKQAGVLQQLFGKESITAIAPMLTNLDQLKENLSLVADETKYAGSMQREYETRSKTTANSLQLLRNKVAVLGITVGNVLLPPLNSFLQFIGPLIDQVSSLAAAHPWLIKGILGAGAAFIVLRLGVMGAVMATRVLTAVMSMSPVGMLVRGIALAAGFLIANWSSVGPWFKSMWAAVGAAFDSALAWIGGFWKGVRAGGEALWTWLKEGFFAWHPLGIIITNWGAITEWLGGFWEGIKSLADESWAWLKDSLSWSPLDVVAGAWEPLVGWFKGLWEQINAYIKPIMDGAKFITDGVGSGWDWVKEKTGFADTPPASTPGGQQAQLNGELVVKFDNAPPGTRMEPMKTDQPALSVKQNVGYRAMGLAGG